MTIYLLFIYAGRPYGRRLPYLRLLQMMVQHIHESAGHTLRWPVVLNTMLQMLEIIGITIHIVNIKLKEN